MLKLFEMLLRAADRREEGQGVYIGGGTLLIVLLIVILLLYL